MVHGTIDVFDGEFPGPALLRASIIVNLDLLQDIKHYHLVMTNIAIENHHFEYRYTIYKWAIVHGYVK